MFQRIKKIMGILRSILMKGMKGEVRRALVEKAKIPTIFALGFFTNEAKEKQRMAWMESANESLAHLKSHLESIKARVKSLEERQQELDKRLDDLKQRQQQLIEESSSGVSLDEMDQKKQADLVQTAENEGGIWNV